MPTISAIIPCFNEGDLVGKAVDSVLAQTQEVTEIFVVNDGSTDPKTNRFLRDFRAPRTTVLHKENGKIASARNHGIRHANSDYLLTLDADDTFHPTFVEKALTRITADERVGAVTCDARVFGIGPERIVRFPGGGLEDFLTGNKSLACCLLRRKCWEDAGGYDEKMTDGYEDWDFWISATERGWMVASVPEPLYNYRQSCGSMAWNADLNRADLVRWIARKHRDSFAKHVDLVLHRREVECQRLRETIDTLKSSWTWRLGRVFTDPSGLLKGLRRRPQKKT